MKKKDFLYVMDTAIEVSSAHYSGGFTCNNIKIGLEILTNSPFIKEHKLPSNYASWFEVEFMTFGGKLPDYSYEQLKNTRLAALELFKEMMLATKGYEKIKL